MRKKIKRIPRQREKIPVTMTKGSADVLCRLAFLDKEQPHAVLATVSGNAPYTSIVAYAISPDLKGLIFATPRNTRKYINITKNKKVCLLVDSRSNTKSDYIKAESISIIGDASMPRKGALKEDLIRILLKKHPRLRQFARAESTALIFVRITKCIHVSSFQIVSEHYQDAEKV